MYRCLVPIFVVATCFALVIAACSTTKGPVPAGQVLPAQGFQESWQNTAEVQVYDADTLFDYIDGEAELYFPYGFQEAAATTYGRTGAPGTTIDAGVYRMGSRLDAFGIYSNYRAPSAERVSVGCEGVLSHHQLVFYQDTYFVRLNGLGNADEIQTDLLSCATAIAARLPGNETPPEELGILSFEGVDPGSVRYIGESLLGYAFLPRGLVANFDVERQSARVFLAMFVDQAAAGAGLDDYIAYLKEYNADKTLREDTSSGYRTLLAQDPLYKGTIMRQVGRYVLGAVSISDSARGETLAGRLQSNLP